MFQFVSFFHNQVENLTYHIKMAMLFSLSVLQYVDVAFRSKIHKEQKHIKKILSVSTTRIEV